MFVAQVLVCYLFDPSNCLVAEDQRGPYATLDRCEARVEELISDINDQMPMWKPTHWRCDYTDEKTAI